MNKRINGTSNNTIDILTFIKYIFRRWYWLLFGMSLGAAASLPINDLYIVPTYTCQVSFYLTSSEDDMSYGTLQATSTIMKDYLAMIESKTVLRRAIDDGNLEVDEKDISNRMKVSNPDNTRLLIVSVKSKDQQKAEKISKAIANQIINYIPKVLVGATPHAVGEHEITVDEQKVSIVTTSILGFLIYFGLLFIMFLIQPTTDDPEDIARESGGSRVFIFPLKNRKNNKQKVLEHSMELSEKEILFSFFSATDGPQVIMVNSPSGEEGSSYMAKRLWKRLLCEGISAILLDGNLVQLGKEEQAEKPKTNRKSSISDKDEAPLLRKPSESVFALEQKGALKETLEKLKGTNVCIIIDAGPVLQTPETLILAKHCDKIAMVVRYGKTSMHDLKRSIHQFYENKLSVDAIILNRNKFELDQDEN